MEREKIITLIVEDMKHNQLLNGLNSIGLADNDRYVLKIDLLVAELMGFSSNNIPDAWLDLYQKTMLDLTNNVPIVEVEQQAIILYDTLHKIKV